MLVKRPQRREAAALARARLVSRLPQESEGGARCAAAGPSPGAKRRGGVERPWGSPSPGSFSRRTFICRAVWPWRFQGEAVFTALSPARAAAWLGRGRGVRERG